MGKYDSPKNPVPDRINDLAAMYGQLGETMPIGRHIEVEADLVRRAVASLCRDVALIRVSLTEDREQGSAHADTTEFEFLLSRFEQAATEKSWKGSQPPEDWESIDNYYREAKKEIILYVEGLLCHRSSHSG